MCTLRTTWAFLCEFPTQLPKHIACMECSLINFFPPYDGKKKGKKKVADKNTYGSNAVHIQS